VQRRSVAALVAGAAFVALGAVARATPRPSAALIRAVFDAGARRTRLEMERHQPRVPVSERLGILYGRVREHTRYDVYRPEAAASALPTIVWLHGGAWISGSRADPAQYLRILAAEGFTTVSVDYSIGPEATYPTAVRQVNEALRHLIGNADSLGVDPSRIVLAGDSAGAQLASQVAAVTTNPALAELLGLEPALRPEQLRATILACGVFDFVAMARLEGLTAWGLQVALWTYTGRRRWSESSAGSTMSTIDWVTSRFPPTFITAGNGDALTFLQSVPFANRLRRLGVEVTTLFWPITGESRAPHEYQFHLDLPEAQVALEKTVEFLKNQLHD
jgi:acetyl esterase/lipase